MTCYLCGTQIENDNISVEHIIPNSLGGKLKSDEILCKQCNSKLGKEIDGPFIEIFSPFSNRLNIARDRQRGRYAVEGRLIISDNEYIEVICNKNKVVPKTPLYRIDDDKNVIYIFAQKRAAKQFKTKIEKDFKKSSKNIDEYEIVIKDDLYGLIEVDFKINNDAFQMGFVKIAIGFAIENGVKRESLDRVLDINNKCLKSEGNLISYYPIGDFEDFLEKIRPDLDYYYPTHMLILFSRSYKDKDNNLRKELYCFVELFSTFQYYVILSDNYQGPDIERYYLQSILKQNKPKIQLGYLDMKDLAIFCKEFNIEYSELKQEFKLYCERINEDKMDFNEFCAKFFEEKISEKKLYEVDMFYWMDDMIGIIDSLIVFSDQPKEEYKELIKKGQIPEKFKPNERILSQLYKMQEVKKLSIINNIRNLYFLLNGEDDFIINLSNFRRYSTNLVKKDGDLRQEETFFIPFLVRLHSNEEEYQLISYKHARFNDLCRFLTLQLLESKNKNIQ